MRLYKVGGAVRDRLLGRTVEETDWVVIGSSAAEMHARGFRPVGADFPVFLHPETQEEYALARTERKTGHGYAGFTFYTAPEVTLEEDLVRRDLTINAMAEASDGTLIDPYGGQQDLTKRILRHVSPAFVEDPLRVLRVARFAARYHSLGFRVAPETLVLMRSLAESGELTSLSAERCWKEFSRALLEPCPDIFIELLHQVGALAVLLPEVDCLFGVPQPTKHHPEIDTGMHILAVLRQAAVHTQPLAVRWACLVHDLGKGQTAPTLWPQHIGHEQRGIPLVEAVNARYRPPKDCQELALLVCALHLHCHRAFELTEPKLLKLILDLDGVRRPERLKAFVAACTMDAQGRSGLEQQPYPQAKYLEEVASVIRAVRVTPLLSQGLAGAALGAALEQLRLYAIRSVRHNFSTASASTSAVATHP